MTSPYTPGIAAGRLDAATLANNFDDLHAPYAGHEAAVAADRCYFCHDAPCVTACPTDIDIPLFIRQIATGMPEAAARTILEQNILGGMCARVCPTETLCEEVCVRETAEGKPVEIGRLQRFATDTILDKPHPFMRAPDTGKTIAVFGAGPAGLACAHRLAMHGHKVELYDARDQLAGLNEYGIAAYKSVGGFAQAEVDWLMQIGGIQAYTNFPLTGAKMLAEYAGSDTYDAVFLGIGLGGVNALAADGADMDGVLDAVSFIADLRQASDLSSIPVGRNVVVIGGGMTAIDAAVQAKLLGADTVTVAYRRGTDRMGASQFEQDLATSKGVRLLTNVVPKAIHGNGSVREIELAYVDADMTELGDTVKLPADQVFCAIGQSLVPLDGLALDGRKIAVTGAGRTSMPKVWAGGDCTPGKDLTVVAVAEGRDAAEDIHATLTGSAG